MWRPSCLGSGSGIILLKDLVKGLFLTAYIDLSFQKPRLGWRLVPRNSFILWTSSITIRDGVLFNPSMIKFEQIDGLGVWAP